MIVLHHAVKDELLCHHQKTQIGFHSKFTAEFRPHIEIFLEQHNRIKHAPGQLFRRHAVTERFRNIAFRRLHIVQRSFLE